MYHIELVPRAVENGTRRLTGLRGYYRRMGLKAKPHTEKYAGLHA